MPICRGTIKKWSLDNADGGSATGANRAIADDLEKIKTEFEAIDSDLAVVEAGGGGSGGSGGGLTHTFTSVDALAAGDFSVIRSDGQVEAIATMGGVFANGTPDILHSDGNSTEQYAGINSQTGRIVGVWQIGAQNDVRAAVGEIVGDGSVTWSTPQQILDHSAAIHGFRLVDIPGTSNLAFFFEDPDIGTDGALRCQLLTVNTGPDSITAQASVTVHEAAVGEVIRSEFLGWDPVEDRLVALYRSNGAQINGSVRVGAVSGTSTTWGTEVDFTTETPRDIWASYDTNAAKWLVVWQAATGTPANEGVARVMTVDAGTESASFGTEAQFAGNAIAQPLSVYSPTAQKHVITYQDDADSDDVNSRVVTVSGTSVSFGAEAPVTNGESAFASFLIHHSLLDQIIVTGRLISSGFGYVKQGTISGTDITWDDQNTWRSSNVSATPGDQVAFDLPSSSPDAEALLWYKDGVAGELLSEVVHLAQGVVTNADSWLVAAAEAIAEDGSGEFTLPGGVNANQIGLTPGVKQYLGDDGTLQTVDNGRPAGVALSATEIQLSTARLN